ncbi:MAG: Ig-like domain-containing protein [Aestuariibaculum sp.]
MNRTINYWLICTMAFFIVFSVSCDSDDDEVVAEEITVNKLTVENAVDNLLEFEVGDQFTVNIIALPEEAVDKDLYSYTFSSTNEDVFTVTEQGVINALSAGEAALKVYPVNNTDLWTVVTIKVKEKVFLVESINILGGNDIYMGPDTTIDLNEWISITPEYASDNDLLFASSDASVATVTRKGLVSAIGLGDATITITADDGSNVSTTINLYVRNTSYQDLNRDNWTVSTSHQYFADATVVGTPESLIDNPDAYGTNPDEPTCLCLVKPGKSLGGITVEANEEVHFVIDMQQEEEFTGFRLRHRVKNTSKNLRLIEASVYGSNDGINFTLVEDEIAIDVEATEAVVNLSKTVKYRYFKLTYDKWASGGSTVQVSDFNITKIVYEP